MVGMLMLRIPRRFWNATMIRSLLLCSFITLVSYVGGRGHALRLSFGLRLQGSRSTFVPMFVRTIVAFDLGCPTFRCHPLLQGQIDRWDERESPPFGWVGLHLNETGWHGRRGEKRENGPTVSLSHPLWGVNVPFSFTSHGWMSPSLWFTRWVVLRSVDGGIVVR